MIKQCLISATLLAVAACAGPSLEVRAVSSSEQLPDTASELLEEGRRQFASGNFALASRAFRKAIRLSPAEIRGYNGLAASYDRMGRFDLSRHYYAEALALAPQDPVTLNNVEVSVRMQRLTPRNGALFPRLQSEIASEDAARPVLSSAVSDARPPRAGPEHEENTPRLVRLSPFEALLQTGSFRTFARKEAFHASTPLPPKESSAVKAPRLSAAISTNVVPSKVQSLRIMNAVGRKEQASRLKSFISDFGWQSVDTGDLDERREESFIIHPIGSEEAASNLSKQLPFKTTVSASPLATRLVLVLGANAVPFDRQLLARR